MEIRRIFSLVFMFVVGLLVGYYLFYNNPKEEIPLVRFEKKISQMEPNESGYTVNWAVSYDGNEYKINSNYSVSPNPGGTVGMLVRRLSDGSYEAYPTEIIKPSTNWMEGIDIKVHQ